MVHGIDEMVHGIDGLVHCVGEPIDPRLGFDLRFRQRHLGGEEDAMLAAKGLAVLGHDRGEAFQVNDSNLVILHRTDPYYRTIGA